MVTSGFCSTASWCDRTRPASAPSIWSARRGFLRPNRGRILIYEPKRDLLAHYRTGPPLYSPKYNLLCRLRPRRRWWQAVVWGGSPGPVVERLCYLAVVAVAVSILPDLLPENSSSLARLNRRRSSSHTSAASV